MRIYKDVDYKDFDFWGGAKDTVKYLTDTEGQQVFDWLEAYYECRPLTETEVNDIFWFETDTIADLLGYEDWDALMYDRE